MQNSEVNKWEELERFKAAADRLVERARQDPEVARAFMRDIGYYKMMEQDAVDNASTIQTTTPKTTKTKR